MSSITKPFADGTSIFSVVHVGDLSRKQLNDDLSNIFQWVFQWKMCFNPDLAKQAQEVVFSRKTRQTQFTCCTEHLSKKFRTIFR